MFSTIKPVSLTNMRRIAANMSSQAPLTKVNQYVMQLIGESFGKDGKLIKTYSPEQPQLHSANVVGNVEFIALKLGLSEGEKALSRDFIRKIYSAFHENELCGDFISHWTDEGIIIEPYLDIEISKTLSVINNDMASIANDYLGNLFARIMSDTPTNIFSWENPDEREISYINDIENISDKKREKLRKLVNEGNLTKYAAKMRKYGLTMLSYTEKDGEVIPKTLKLVKSLDDTVTVKIPEDETVSNVKPLMDEWTKLLNTNVISSNPAEESIKLDKIYMENGVHYEEALTISKQTGLLCAQLSAGTITTQEAIVDISRYLERVLGADLFSRVRVYVENGALLVRIKNKADVENYSIKSAISARLANTKILN